MSQRTASLTRLLAKAPFGISPIRWTFILVLFANWLFSLCWFIATKLFVTWTPDAWNTLDDKLRLVIHNAVFAGALMLAAIAAVAAQRLDPSMMVGHKVRPNSALDINNRVILNTAEQFLLHLIGQIGLMLYAPASEARVLVSLTVLWILGRALFWIGYHKDARLRAFGFGVTFYPTICVYIWLTVRYTTGYHLF